MDYIQNKLYRAIKKTKKRQTGRDSTIVGYYNVLIQYQLYLMFACVWDRREPDLTRTERMQYLTVMKRATLGTILNIIIDLDSKGSPILGVGKDFQFLINEFIKARNTETAHGILIPGIQEGSYHELAVKYEEIHDSIRKLNIPILSEDCKIYYRPSSASYQVTVFDCDDYDYQDLNEQLVHMLDLQPNELHYFFGDVCYRIYPFLILREIENKEDPYEIYCYQEYNLKNGRFEYKCYSELDENVSFSLICKDYFLSFQKEFPHTISKANGVICNKFENNYDFFISTSPIDGYEQKVWQFIKSGKSNACLTIRGGGGIGKTALVQYVCNKNIFEPFSMETIQYVIFCSAKDREFKQTGGLAAHIRNLNDESVVRSYQDIIRTIGWVIESEYDNADSIDEKRIENELIKSSGVLLIIDDFETLSEEDKKKVVSLSSRLDVMKHKMIITTRSQYMVGEEYYIGGLDRNQTIEFMKERFRRNCTESQCVEFDNFVQDKDIKKRIFSITKGLPLLAIQLGNIFVLNGFNENALIKKENEEEEDFLLGRLYSYFGTKTSKILFLVIARLFEYGSEDIKHTDLKIMYSLSCERIGIADVDYEQDLQELKKLNVILVETDYIKISNYISSRIIRKCQDELFENDNVDIIVFDDLLFKNIIELGMKEGVLKYSESDNRRIDFPFIRTFVFENQLMYTNDVRFSILEKHILSLIDNLGKIRDLFRDSCKYFDVQDVENRFAYWSKKHGFIIPELSDKRDVIISDSEISPEYYLQEIINEFNDMIDKIDEFIEIRRKGDVSQSFCRDMMQDIRGKLGSVCNIKLSKVFELDLNKCRDKLVEVKELMDEISYTPEFNMKEYEQYIKLEDVIRST